MKNYFVTLILLLFALGCCYAQDTIRRFVPLLKESNNVDSLISSVINIPDKLRAPENDSCLLMGLFNTNNDAGFITGIRALNKRRKIFSVGDFRDDKTLGYFEFRGYLIFVYGDTSMKGFFTTTKSKKEFTFIKAQIKDIEYGSNYFVNWTLFYRNGTLWYGVH